MWACSSRAVTRVKSEQAPKVLMRMPTRLHFGEGRVGGNRHVRFERGQETECCHMAQATAPVLDSTWPRRDWRE
jgi:hypothetical protein